MDRHEAYWILIFIFSKQKTNFHSFCHHCEAKDTVEVGLNNLLNFKNQVEISTENICSYFSRQKHVAVICLLRESHEVAEWLKKSLSPNYYQQKRRTFFCGKISSKREKNPNKRHGRRKKAWSKFSATKMKMVYDFSAVWTMATEYNNEVDCGVKQEASLSDTPSIFSLSQQINLVDHRRLTVQRTVIPSKFQFILYSSALFK